MAARLWGVVWNISRPDLVRSVSKESRWSLLIRAETLVSIWSSLYTYQAEQHWTFSIPSTRYLCQGDHTVEAYSSWGHTKALYTRSFNCTDAVLTFLRNNPSVQFALVIISWMYMCLSYFRLDCKVTPRYLQWSKDGNVDNNPLVANFSDAHYTGPEKAFL